MWLVVERWSLFHTAVFRLDAGVHWLCRFNCFGPIWSRLIFANIFYHESACGCFRRGRRSRSARRNGGIVADDAGDDEDAEPLEEDAQIV